MSSRQNPVDRHPSEEPRRKRSLPSVLRILLILLILFVFGGSSDEVRSVLQDLTQDVTVSEEKEQGTADSVSYTFRSSRLREEHYEKHGIEMGFDSAQDYEQAASAVVNNPNALHKTEKEDGDDVYYLEASNEFVIVSTDGYLRTYFYPSDGIAYFNRQ